MILYAKEHRISDRSRDIPGVEQVTGYQDSIYPLFRGIFHHPFKGMKDLSFPLFCFYSIKIGIHLGIQMKVSTMNDFHDIVPFP